MVPLVVCFVVTAVAAEAIVTSKLHGSLARVTALFTVGFVIATRFDGEIALPVAAVFWSGMFLCWFGLRSHVESSILFRLVVFLADAPAGGQELVSRYHQEYGSTRLEELERGGLIARTADTIRITPLGRTIITLARVLRRGTL